MLLLCSWQYYDQIRVRFVKLAGGINLSYYVKKGPKINFDFSIFWKYSCYINSYTYPLHIFIHKIWFPFNIQYSFHCPKLVWEFKICVVFTFLYWKFLQKYFHETNKFSIEFCDEVQFYMNWTVLQKNIIAKT